MNLVISSEKNAMGLAAASEGAAAIREAIADHGKASIIVATGASQFTVLDTLVEAEDIDWSRVTIFHLDEYVGLPITHPASFRLYLWERLVRRLPVPVRAFHAIDGNANPSDETSRLGALIKATTIDVAFVGIGENAHLAFNDPPADFNTHDAYLLVQLDEACRKQQLGEGWFATLEDVPKQAISMSVNEILRSKKIICSVPDERKAHAVQGAVEGPVTPDVPASALQNHPNCTLHLDTAAASKLSGAGV